MRRLLIVLSAIALLLVGGTAAAQAGGVEGADMELAAWVLGGGAATAGAGLTALYRMLLKPHVDHFNERLDAIDARLKKLEETGLGTDRRLRSVETWFDPNTVGGSLGETTRANTAALAEIRSTLATVQTEARAARDSIAAAFRREQS